MRSWFMGFVPWVRWLILACLVVLGYLLLSSAWNGVKEAIFGDPEVQRERGNTVVAREETKAEANIADKTIERVRERDVYREHVTNIVREGQGKVNEAWNGETVGKDVDAAGADTLCRLHDSLCRPDRAAQVQPVREPVPGADGAR